MDIVNQIAGKLGVSQDKAGGVLGTLLGAVQQQLGKSNGAEASKQFGDAVPELGGLKEQSESVTGGGGMLGSLGAKAGGLLGGAGGGKAGVLAEVAGKLSGSGIQLSSLSSIMPIVLPFLSSRLPPDLMAKVSSMLGGGAEQPV